MLQPAQIDPPRSPPDDPRLGHLLGRKLSGPEEAWVVLLGFPMDEGVRRNRGRVGAAQAPDAIRRALYRLTPDPEDPQPFLDLVEHTADLGNLQPCGDLERDQKNLAEAVAPLLRRRTVAVVLGGGHETAYGHFLGYVESRQRVHILNWDAHADVRPLLRGQGHSGSPFRQALEHRSNACQSYTVAGLSRHAVGREHLVFLKDRGSEYFWHDDLSRAKVLQIYTATGAPLMVTFDLDAVDQAYAPGVSAPATAGLPPALWLYAAYQAGRRAGVTSIDLVELNPTYDRDAQTARLAALTVWWFFKGLAERGTRGGPGSTGSQASRVRGSAAEPRAI